MEDIAKTPQGPSATYSDFRKCEYPPIDQQLDMLYWDYINGTTNWLDTITQIKNKYVKNNSVGDLS
jgi:hypothetical protein